MINLDTHILLHALAGDLSAKEEKILSTNTWGISAIVLWEIAKLASLKRIELKLDSSEVVQALSKIHTWPLDLDVCRALGHLDFKSDPADEIIVATSMVHKVPLLTRDQRMKKTKLVDLL
jgi:PIN domain nuclease of toxin-antitoxin system